MSEALGQKSTLSSKTPATFCIQYVKCDADEKSSQLVHFLKKHLDKKVILYFMTCASVDFWGTVLPQLVGLNEISSVSLHGKMKQSVREKALATFAGMSVGVMFCTDVAARGLDIPGVDWIVQYDPPQDPNVFVHRVGRTARMGRSGNALVFLLPKEDVYVEFLQIRRVPVEERRKWIKVKDITLLLRKAAKEDRDVMEKGLRAFVSFVRAYKEHHCSYIFRWKELELGKLAMGYGLLQLPSMPELKRKTFSVADFVPVTGIDFTSIRYKDKSREKQRQRNLAGNQQGKSFADVKEKVNAPCQGAVSKKQKRPVEVQKAYANFEDDYDEIEKDYRLMKKLKKGVISELEFAKCTGTEESLASDCLPSVDGSQSSMLVDSGNVPRPVAHKPQKNTSHTKKFSRQLDKKHLRKHFHKGVPRGSKKHKRKVRR
ncbi:hypothetical protein O6H91_17G085700 [Diphasiastrum complanatum]|uniref:Uncharacterized protein n=2 Tax=Diphasiastrum complanatum TaxID=34168 RepID=A0ACC2B8Y4_DIPCM|nr:hypothetical protein O6H91_17G085700 [Diphasiastrum complanatum]KAJ7526178.1 hypothetical protein O6H91_17G085700 [Diphasiastrum complanatum]